MAGLNETPAGERVHIAFLGVRNAGKSSLVNAVTGQDLAVVSHVAGTTTDPVRKAMELLPVGPVLVVDTPGIDDAGDLGDLRVKKALRALDAADVAVLVVDSTRGMLAQDRALVAVFRERKLPYVIAWNKCDVADRAHAGAGEVEGDGAGSDGAHAHAGADEVEGGAGEAPAHAGGEVRFAQVSTSALTGEGVDALKRAIARLATDARPQRRLVADLLCPGDVLVCVVPIDSAAPKGRLILPQQQVIRDCIEAGAVACVTSAQALGGLLETLAQPPRLVVTDSQAFGEVARIVPGDVPLTSFSILMARYKGTLDAQVGAIRAIRALGGSSRVLVAEGCTHHRQCGDIGTVKIPASIRALCGADLRFDFTSGGEFPGDVGGYDAVVHCGGCMLNAQEMQHRAEVAARAGVPFANYGMVLAQASGVLERSLAPLGRGEDDE